MSRCVTLVAGSWAAVASNVVLGGRGQGIHKKDCVGSVCYEVHEGSSTMGRASWWQMNATGGSECNANPSPLQRRHLPGVKAGVQCIVTVLAGSGCVEGRTEPVTLLSR